jgi:hypothetical protein
MTQRPRRPPNDSSKLLHPPVEFAIRNLLFTSREHLGFRRRSGNVAFEAATRGDGTVMHGRPRFAKLHVAMVQRSRLQPCVQTSVPSAGRLSLMEYADEVPIKLASLVLFDSVGFDSSRSDLSCHHVMIAQVIGGCVLLFAANLMLSGATYFASRIHARAGGIRSVVSQQSPHDPRVLVGQRDGGHIGIATL